MLSTKPEEQRSVRQGTGQSLITRCPRHLAAGAVHGRCHRSERLRLHPYSSRTRPACSYFLQDRNRLTGDTGKAT